MKDFSLNSNIADRRVLVISEWSWMLNLVGDWGTYVGKCGITLAPPGQPDGFPRIAHPATFYSHTFPT